MKPQMKYVPHLSLINSLQDKNRNSIVKPKIVVSCKNTMGGVDPDLQNYQITINEEKIL